MRKSLMSYRVNIVCTAALYNALVDQAKKEGLPVSEIVRRAIAEGLKRKAA